MIIAYYLVRGRISIVVSKHVPPEGRTDWVCHFENEAQHNSFFLHSRWHVYDREKLSHADMKAVKPNSIVKPTCWWRLSRLTDWVLQKLKWFGRDVCPYITNINTIIRVLLWLPLWCWSLWCRSLWGTSRATPLWSYIWNKCEDLHVSAVMRKVTYICILLQFVIFTCDM